MLRSRAAVRFAVTTVGATWLLGLGLGCAEDPGDSAFRPYTPPGEFWEWGMGVVDANASLDIYAGEDATSIGCLSYPIGGDVPTTVQEWRPDRTFVHAMTVVENVIYDASGTARCIGLQNDENPALFYLADGDSALYTLWGTFLFDGYVGEIPTPGSAPYVELLNERLTYSLSANQMFAGGYWKKDVLATFTVDDVAFADPMRKLLFAALVGARCGAVGLVPAELMGNLPPPEP